MLENVIASVIGCLIALFIFKMLNKNKQENFSSEKGKKYLKCVENCQKRIENSNMHYAQKVWWKVNCTTTEKCFKLLK